MDALKLTLAANWHWFAAIVLLTGAILRSLHADTALSISLPKRWLPLVGLAVGLLGGVVVHGALGRPWALALAGGELASLLAMAGYDVLFKSLLGGWQVPMGKP